MRYKPIFVIVSVLVLLTFFASCDQFFETNLFKQANIGQVTSSSLATMAAPDIIAASGVLTSKPSDSFFEAFAAASEATKAAVVETVRSYYNFPADDPLWVAFSASSKGLGKSKSVQTPAEREAGYLFLASMYLYQPIAAPSGTTPTNILAILNAASNALLGKDFSSLGVADAYSVLSTIPTYVKTDASTFGVMVDRFVALDDVYDALAADPVHINTPADTFVTVTDSGIKGSIAQTALVASIIKMCNPLPGSYSDGAGHNVVINVSDTVAVRRKAALFAAVNYPTLLESHPENRFMLYQTPATFGDDFHAEISSGKLSYLFKAAGIDIDSFSF